MRISDGSSDVCSSDLAASLADVWRRHILDSAQLFPFLDEDDEIVDIGSGAGFPGLVLAIMGLQNIRLVESNQGKDRKSVVWGKSLSVRVELGGRRIIKKKNNHQQ